VVYRGQDGKKRIIAQRLEGSLDCATQPSSFGHAAAPAAAAPAQTYTITADGKRRITPMAVGGGGGGGGSGVVQVLGNAAGSRAMPATAMGSGGSVNPIFQGGGHSAAGGAPPPLQSNPSHWSNPPQSHTQYTAQGGGHTLAAAQYHYQYAPVALHPTDASHAVQPLMAPQPGIKLVATVQHAAGAVVSGAAAGGMGEAGDEVSVVEVTNRQAGSGVTAVTACVVRLRRAGVTLWTDTVSSAATLAAATDSFVAVALVTGVLMVRCR
jgi:hypothetical protein